MNAKTKLLLFALALSGFSQAVLSDDFTDRLERIQEALRVNPSKVLPPQLDACRSQVGYATKLYNMGMSTRAERALDFCFESLKIPEGVPTEEFEAISQQDLAAKADAVFRQAQSLTPDPANGLKIYRECAACHQPEGWGSPTGSVPQIAGQHRSVVIRQLADFRSGNRDSVVMMPYASTETIGGAQAVADVAAYVESLEISVDNGKGPETALDLGRSVYLEYCAGCHGESGEGDNVEAVPRLQAQHYRYLQRQFQWIRDGKRRNANEEMAAQIKGLENHEIEAVLDYVSRLEPPEELQAPEGWKNPDFQR